MAAAPLCGGPAPPPPTRPAAPASVPPAGAAHPCVRPAGSHLRCSRGTRVQRAAAARDESLGKLGVGEDVGGMEGGGGGEGRQPPGPPGLPVFGHAPLMVWLSAQGLNLEDMLLRWTQQYGPFYQWQMPDHPPVVHVTDPEAIRQAFEVHNWPKSPLYKDLMPLLGEHSMVLTAGEEWREQREAFNPGFSSSFLRSSLPGFVECSQRLVQLLDAAAAEGKVVRMHELAILTTLEVICQVGFGERVDLLLAGGITNRLWTAFEALGLHVAFFMDNVPLNGLKLLPWNQAKTQRLQADLDSQLLAILRRRLAAMGAQDSSDGSRSSTSRSRNSSSNSNSGSACPFHTAAAAAAAPATAGSEDSGGGMASSSSGSGGGSRARDILSLAVEVSAQHGGAAEEQMLLSQMKTFFAAGHDTTASLVAWAVWYLCTHPEAEARLVAELRAVQAQGASAADGFTWQQLQQCTYLGAILKETLRVRPPVGIVARQAPPGATLGGYDVGGKIILVSPYVLHRGPMWGADAKEWKPERWLEGGGASEVATAQPYCYLPFSRGPRNCIGEKFALLEAKTILSMLYSTFEFEYAGERPEQAMMSVTAHPRYGVPLHVRRRKSVAAAGQQQGQQN